MSRVDTMESVLEWLFPKASSVRIADDASGFKLRLTVTWDLDLSTLRRWDTPTIADWLVERVRPGFPTKEETRRRFPSFSARIGRRR